MQERLARSVAAADLVYCYARDLGWDAAQSLAALGTRAQVHADIDALVEELARIAQPGDHLLVMSNGGFGGIHEKLLARLAASGQKASA
jgi:UDP-N-acetylmuramate: L-alanyl-gamma-D-glutamyl-meso-diaminopimelate ligase